LVPGARFLEESARLRAEWLDLSREIAPARQDAARAGELAARGLASPAELEGAVLRLERARSAPRLLLARQRDAWTAELEEARGHLRELAAERASLLAEAGLHDVRTPVDGTVEAVEALSPGSWVAAGQEIATVSPEAPLLAEVFLDSREVGRVREGMPVRLLVDAFDHHEWGTLPAEVAEVGQDFTVVGGRPLFRVRCRPLREWLRRPDGAIAKPGKGMAVTATFTLGRRTLLHLLWDRTAGAERDDTGHDPAPAP
jgi:multidrug resistance efflux pump